MKPSWQATILALGFLGFVSFALWLAANHDFTTIWTAVGSIVGVVVGAIPSYFFKTQSDLKSVEAAHAHSLAAALAAAVPPDVALQINDRYNPPSPRN